MSRVVLELNPPKELVFKGPPGQPMLSSLSIRNVSDRTVGYLIKTTSRDFFLVNPNGGIIQPLQTVDTKIRSKSDTVTEPLDLACHKFRVQYIFVDDECSYSQFQTKIRQANTRQIKNLKLTVSAEIIEVNQVADEKLKAHEAYVSKPENKECRLEVGLYIAEEEKKHAGTQMKAEKKLKESESLVARAAGNEQMYKDRIEELETALAEEKKKHSDPQMELESCISFWEVSHSDVKLTEENIDNGAWACVLKGFFKEQPVAVKCVHKNIVSSHTISLLKREVAMMAKIRHPCLLLFIAVSFDHPSGSPMIITELMDCSFRDAYNKKGMLNSSSKIRIMIDVARALHYLHTHKDRILHRDVSSANVLIYRAASDTHRGKLSDFGSANIARHAVTTTPGAEIYMAPEVPRESRSMIHSAKLTTKIDVYSYGILLCEVFASEPQLPFMQVIKTMQDSIKSQFPFMHELIVKCTQRNPDARPEIINILCELKDKFPNIFYDKSP